MTVSPAIVVFDAERDVLMAAANSLRTLAAIQDAVLEVEMLGGLVGQRRLAVEVFNHLQGGDADAIREQADAVERLLA